MEFWFLVSLAVCLIIAGSFILGWEIHKKISIRRLEEFTEFYCDIGVCNEGMLIGLMMVTAEAGSRRYNDRLRQRGEC